MLASEAILSNFAPKSRPRTSTTCRYLEKIPSAQNQYQFP